MSTDDEINSITNTKEKKFVIQNNKIIQTVKNDIIEVNSMEFKKFTFKKFNNMIFESNKKNIIKYIKFFILFEKIACE